MATKTDNNKPQRWSNWIYILAAIGCAAGLGNLWRFPMLAYEYGGAAFIIALLFSNLIIVYPLVMSETIIGQKFRLAWPAAFEKIKRWLWWIQWLPVLLLSFVLMYYTPIMAWAMKYLVSFWWYEWTQDTSTFFMQEILSLSPDITINTGRDIDLVVALIVALVFVALSLRKSVQSLSHVLKFTAIAPFVLLIILLVRAVTLPGASTWLHALFVPDRSQLLNVSMRNAAIGQSFFSASLAFGYFIVSWSHRPVTAEVPRSTLWILSGNFLVSLLSGIVVFATLGFMATQQGIALSDVAQWGPMLVFTILPEAIATMPFGQDIFLALLMIVIITLAVDSVFGIVEAIVWWFGDIVSTSYRRILLVVLGVAFVWGLVYTTHAWLYYLDITDHYLGSFMLLLIGLLELSVILFVIKTKTMRQWIDTTIKTPLWRWFDMSLWLSFFIIGWVLIAALSQELQWRYEDYPVNYIIWFGMIPLIIVIWWSFVLHYTQRRAMQRAIAQS